MSDIDASPFSRPKSKLWVWIIPSVLLHLIILVIWLLLPEPEPRQPGERKLTINKEQAEELQEHVEEANLKELRKKVLELQLIKAQMIRIREREMAAVIEFEQDMAQEAPKDVAMLLRELAENFELVRETHVGIESSLELLREWQPKILQAAENETIDGLRLLPNLEPYWISFDGIGDRLEVAFYETNANLNAIDVKLEWIEDASIAEKIEALKGPIEATRKMDREAWGAVPASWKRARSFTLLTEDLDGTIESIERFRLGEIDGKAQVAKKRNEQETRIAEIEAELVRTNEALQSDEAALEEIDRGKSREAWSAKREDVRAHDRAQGQLQRELRDLEKSLSRTEYKQDQRLAREVKRIEDRLQHAVPEPPDQAILTNVMAQQQTMITRLEDLAESLEAAR